MKRVRKAVFPAAGLGTRFLPATKTVPKELLPVVDTPGIELVAAEELADVVVGLELEPAPVDHRTATEEQADAVEVERVQTLQRAVTALG